MEQERGRNEIRVQKSPWGNGGWEEPRGSQEQELPDGDPETSQNKTPCGVE